MDKKPTARIKSRTIYIGIDPGKSGAIAAIWPDGSARAWHTPITKTTKKFARAKTKSGKQKKSVKVEYDPLKMFNLLRHVAKFRAKGYEVKVVIEDQHAFQNDGKSAVFAVGEGFGRWMQLPPLLGLQITKITASAWRPCYVPTGSGKSVSLERARTLFPGIEMPLKKDEARADALLIADYVRRRENGIPFLMTRAKRKPIVNNDAENPRKKKRRFRQSSLLQSSFSKR